MKKESTDIQFDAESTRNVARLLFLKRVRDLLRVNTPIKITLLGNDITEFCQELDTDEILANMEEEIAKIEYPGK